MDLGPAGQVGQKKLARIEAAIDELEKGSPANQEALRRFRLAMLREYRAAWRGYLAESEVIYQVVLQRKGQPPLSRTWSLAPGQRQELRLEAAAYRAPALAAIGGTALALVILSGLAIWRLTRPKAP